MRQQHLDRLTSIDASFLHQEGEQSHMHIGAVLVFDGPPPKLTDDVRVEAARRYIQVCELVTGRPFVPDAEEPIGRIKRNLGL